MAVKFMSGIGILLRKLFWPTVIKNCDEKPFFENSRLNSGYIIYAILIPFNINSI